MITIASTNCSAALTTSSAVWRIATAVATITTDTPIDIAAAIGTAPAAMSAPAGATTAPIAGRARPRRRVAVGEAERVMRSASSISSWRW